ncbi:MAG: hypothetical protein N3B16_04480 [Candidatus Aminicenantes bacterium]|nr:hypothetical protein [Candidatus Aminicenantes bacterium]
MKEFMLDLDRPRKLIFDFDAWDLISEHFGSAEGKELDLASLNITYRDLPFLVYAGLKWEDESLTFEQTKKLLNEAIRSGKLDIMKILDVVMGAIFAQSGLKQPELKAEIVSGGEVPKNMPTAEDTPEAGSGNKEN